MLTFEAVGLRIPRITKLGRSPTLEELMVDHTPEELMLRSIGIH